MKKLDLQMWQKVHDLQLDEMIDTNIMKVDTSISMNCEKVGAPNSNCKNDVAIHDGPCKYMFFSFIKFMFINLYIITNYKDLFFNISHNIFESTYKKLLFIVKIFFTINQI
jgi:hypothetical protein